MNRGERQELRICLRGLLETLLEYRDEARNLDNREIQSADDYMWHQGAAFAYEEIREKVESIFYPWLNDGKRKSND